MIERKIKAYLCNIDSLLLLTEDNTVLKFAMETDPAGEQWMSEIPAENLDLVRMNAMSQAELDELRKEDARLREIDRYDSSLTHAWYNYYIYPTFGYAKPTKYPPQLQEQIDELDWDQHAGDVLITHKNVNFVISNPEEE
jgi:hypothetical protein